MGDHASYGLPRPLCHLVERPLLNNRSEPNERKRHGGGYRKRGISMAGLPSLGSSFCNFHRATTGGARSQPRGDLAPRPQGGGTRLR